MKIATLCVALALAPMSVGALAQGMADPMEKLRACSLLAHAERLECLEKLSRDISPLSPAGHSAVICVPDGAGGGQMDCQRDDLSARLHAARHRHCVVRRRPDSSTMQFSIQCRGGRTDLVIAGPALTSRAEDYVVSYSVNNGQPATIAAGAPASGPGIAIRGDVVRLLAALPDRGAIAFAVAVADRRDAALEGRYELASLKVVRERLAVPCKWPTAAGAPRN